MLICAAHRPAARPLALAVAGTSKAIFIALVLSRGGRFLGYQAGIAVVVDLVWVAVFALHFPALRRLGRDAVK
jgi:hypothetical protein